VCDAVFAFDETGNNGDEMKSVDKVDCIIRHLADFAQVDEYEPMRARERRRATGGDE
jgi:hypothetical protein